MHCSVRDKRKTGDFPTKGLDTSKWPSPGFWGCHGVEHQMARGSRGSKSSALLQLTGSYVMLTGAHAGPGPGVLVSLRTHHWAESRSRASCGRIVTLAAWNDQTTATPRPATHLFYISPRSRTHPTLLQDGPSLFFPPDRRRLCTLFFSTLGPNLHSFPLLLLVATTANPPPLLLDIAVRERHNIYNRSFGIVCYKCNPRKRPWRAL